MAWAVIQPAPPGILGICVRTSATVPTISVTESMAVRTIRKVVMMNNISESIILFFSCEERFKPRSL